MGPKPRILALHGFRTSADVFLTQSTLATLHKFMEGQAQVVYVNAPNAATGEAFPDVKQYFQGPFYEWWNAQETKQEAVSSGPGADGAPAPGDSVWAYEGMEASLRFLERYMVQQGPFDGLMGFSQGGTLAALAAVLQREGSMFQDVPKIKFCILIAGGRCRDAKYSGLFVDGQAPCPACIMVGEQDPHRSNTEAVINFFADQATVFRHAQGHVVPRLSPEQKDELARLIKTE